MKEQSITRLFIFGSFWNCLKCILFSFFRLNPTASTRRVCAGTYGSRAAAQEGPVALLPTRRRSLRSENTHYFTHIHTILMIITSQSCAVMHAPPHLPTSLVPHSYSSSPTLSHQHNSKLYKNTGMTVPGSAVPPSHHPISSPHLSHSLHIFLSLSGTDWGIGNPAGRWGPSYQFQQLCSKRAPKEQSQGQRWRTTRKTSQRMDLPLSSSQEEETTMRTTRSPIVLMDCLLPA